jgi:hypothetical protein
MTSTEQLQAQLQLALDALRFYGEYPEDGWWEIDADRGAVARTALRRIERMSTLPEKSVVENAKIDGADNTVCAALSPCCKARVILGVPQTRPVFLSKKRAKEWDSRKWPSFCSGCLQTIVSANDQLSKDPPPNPKDSSRCC